MTRGLIAAACLLILAAESRAETRIIAVRVTRSEQAKPRVAISSDEKHENRRDLTIEAAAAILKAAEGWGSKVYVGIEAHDVPLQDCLPLLKAVAENVWLDLAFVEGSKPTYIHDNIRKRIERQAAKE